MCGLVCNSPASSLPICIAVGFVLFASAMLCDASVHAEAISTRAVTVKHAYAPLHAEMPVVAGRPSSTLPARGGAWHDPADSTLCVALQPATSDNPANYGFQTDFGLPVTHAPLDPAWRDQVERWASVFMGVWSVAFSNSCADRDGALRALVFPAFGDGNMLGEAWVGDTENRPVMLYDAGGMQYPRIAALVLVHEIGHVLGLLHDQPLDLTVEYDSGNRWTAPVMGLPYSAYTAHWARGAKIAGDGDEDQVAVVSARLPRVPTGGWAGCWALGAEYMGVEVACAGGCSVPTAHNLWGAYSGNSTFYLTTVADHGIYADEQVGLVCWDDPDVRLVRFLTQPLDARIPHRRAYRHLPPKEMAVYGALWGGLLAMPLYTTYTI
jgi:hypothetical protein